MAAAQSGQVVRTGYNRLRGYYIIIRHEGSVQTLYQHLSYIFVRGGETVTQGQTVAVVGSTGLVTGPHPHLEIILDGVRADLMPGFRSWPHERAVGAACTAVRLPGGGAFVRPYGLSSHDTGLRFRS